MTEPQRSAEEALGVELTRLWAVEPDPDDASRTRAAAAAAFAAAQPSRRRRRWAIVGAASAVTALGGVGAGAAAQDAMPGDLTYTVKIGLERVDRAWARGDAAEALAWLDVAETRIEEAVRAGSEGRFSLLPEILDRHTAAVAAVRRHLAELDEDSGVVPRAASELRVHEAVLDALLGIAPLEARPGLERARDAAHDAHIPDDLDVPPGISPSVPVPTASPVPGSPDEPRTDRPMPPAPRPEPPNRPSSPPVAHPGPGDDGGAAPVPTPERPDSGPP